VKASVTLPGRHGNSPSGESEKMNASGNNAQVIPEAGLGGCWYPPTTLTTWTFVAHVRGAPGRTRTCDTRFRNSAGAVCRVGLVDVLPAHVAASVVRDCPSRPRRRQLIPKMIPKRASQTGATSGYVVPQKCSMLLDWSR
jgi:hypothetical protein